MADQLTEAQISEFKEAFSLFDDDSDGLIDAPTCLKVLRSCGQHPAQSLLTTLKPTLDFPDFLALISRRPQHSTKPTPPGADDTESELKEAFYVLDTERKGYIEVARLRRVLTGFGERLTEREVEEVLEECRVENGRIGLEEFVRVMGGRT
ncbi:calmodulin-related protein CAM53 [Fimicolochytrium jonesii]|uniref:calmodulin-related protein CAM53 n=1 Tax=Fimicolochytrium jonesii TaxID=1396493 RepID=UPI0022FEB7B3|nr:calmodulin-related protein CAM53 [Fimicolochytrium jonesii]KAI8820838.1 calmodulin-related protein CAM53 [Fimicolochytrium jonesii]